MCIGEGLSIFRNLLFSCGSTENEKLSVSYNHMVAPYKLFSKTIGEVMDEAAEKYGDKEALVFSGDNIRMSFVQLKEKVSCRRCYSIFLLLQRQYFLKYLFNVTYF